MRATETARGITVLLPYGFDVDLGRIYHPKLEEKLYRLIFSLPTLHKGNLKANPSIKFGANPMNGFGVMTNYSRKTRSICCHAYRVNRFME